jgi:hypothetical protein
MVLSFKAFLSAGQEAEQSLDGAQQAVQSKGDCTQVDLERARMRFGGIDKLQWALYALT